MHVAVERGCRRLSFLGKTGAGAERVRVSSCDGVAEACGEDGTKASCRRTRHLETRPEANIREQTLQRFLFRMKTYKDTRGQGSARASGHVQLNFGTFSPLGLVLI